MRIVRLIKNHATTVARILAGVILVTVVASVIYFLSLIGGGNPLKGLAHVFTYVFVGAMLLLALVIIYGFLALGYSLLQGGILRLFEKFFNTPVED